MAGDMGRISGGDDGAGVCRVKGRALIPLLLLCVPMPEAMAAPVQTAEAPAPAPALVGGWHPADPDAATKAARFALPHLKEKRPRLRRILSAEQQIVAGVNLRLTLQLRNGHRWRVTVWRKLDGGMVVTEAIRLG